MNDDRTKLAARVAHDVGKYVAMTARNLDAGRAPSAALLSMLVRDLYALRDGERASSVLARLAAPLRALGPDARLDRAMELLGEADALEPSVRAAELAAVSRAAAIALEVEALLRSVAREAP